MALQPLVALLLLTLCCCSLNHGASTTTTDNKKVDQTTVATLIAETDCGSLPTLEGYKFADGKTVAGASRKFECLDGYKLVDSDSVVCTEDGKWHFSGSCLKKIAADCGPIPTCDLGYSLFDFSKICGEDGTWMAGWKCRKDCGELPRIRYGGISDGDNFFGAVREVICNDGFELIGDDSITCGEDGKWSEAAYCRENLAAAEVQVLDLDDGNDVVDMVDVASGSGGEDTVIDEPKQVVGNLSCFDGFENKDNDPRWTDNMAVGYFYWPSDRCNGRYDCVNGADELKCPEKCVHWRYPTRQDFVDCRAYIPMYYYDFETGQCEFFVYGGCADVVNMFQSKQECQNECKGILITEKPGESKLATSTLAIIVKDDDEGEDSKEETITPLAVNSVFAEELPTSLDQEKSKTQVRTIFNLDSRSVFNGAPGNDNTYDNSKKTVDKQPLNDAPAFHNEDTFEENSGETVVISMKTAWEDHLKQIKADKRQNISCEPENENSTQFYSPSDRCDGIYTCHNGADEFNCSVKCVAFVKPSDEEVEECKASIPMYYYEPHNGRCIKFAYGGCGGRHANNLFRTLKECKRECRGIRTAIGNNNNNNNNSDKVKATTAATKPKL